MTLLPGLGIEPSLWRISAKLRVTQLAAIGKDDLLQPAGRVAVLGDGIRTVMTSPGASTSWPNQSAGAPGGRCLDDHVDDVALRIRCVEIDQRVRIGPREFRDRGLLELGDLVGIRRIAMMRERRRARVVTNPRLNTPVTSRQLFMSYPEAR